MDDNRILPFSSRARRGGNEPPDGGDPAADDVAPGNAYAVARGSHSPPALKFFCLGGKGFAMPYAYHPIVWAESPGLVLLEYPGFFTIILAGKDLNRLETHLCEYRVSWIRECDDAQAASLPVAVTRIVRIKSYPSREG